MEPGETLEIEKIVETVVLILKQSDLEEATELKVRTMAADKLGIDPSELSYKWIVRRCVETYLLSLEEEEEEGNKDKQQDQTCMPKKLDEEDKVEPRQRPKQDGDRVIFKLSEKRSLVVHDFGGKTLVSFRDYSEKNGKLLPSARGISLSTEQWSAFRQSVPDVQAAITKMESRKRFKDAKKRMETDTSNSASAAALAQGLIPMEMNQIEEDKFDSATASAPQGAIPMETKQVEVDVSNAFAPKGVISVETKQVEADVSNAETKQFEADASKAARKQVEADISNADTASVPHELVSMETKQIEADKSNFVTTSATKRTISDITNSVTASVTQGVLPGVKNQIEADISNAETTQIESDISYSVTTISSKVAVANGPEHTEADISPRVVVANGPERTGADMSYAAFAFGLPGLVPSKTTRLHGKNYYCWVHQMEIFLERLEIGYVLTDRCPSIPDRLKANFDEIGRAKAEVQKWVNDDYLCCHSILSCLCDNLFAEYSQKTRSAKELWEKLKSDYSEDFGTISSEVNKYMQFEMVDGISVLEQAQELDRIGSSIRASGMWIEEQFHVSAIISKLPPSWKEYRRNLMRDKFLTAVMLMHRLGIEEESRNHAKKEEFAHVWESREDNRFEVEEGDFKRPAMHPEMEKGNRLITCFRCGQKGHISRICPQRMVYVREN